MTCEWVMEYFDRSIAAYDADPPANEYQRGHLDALKVARAELASLTTSRFGGHAIEDIGVERQRQIEGEGWTPEHDDEHSSGEMAHAAACYAMGEHRIIAWSHDGRSQGEASLWPWHRSWWKPADRRRNLVKAAALIAAEIDRIDRTAAVSDAPPEPTS